MIKSVRRVMTFELSTFAMEKRHALPTCIKMKKIFMSELLSSAKALET